MTLTKLETRDLYRKRALRYDFAMWIYRLAGFRVNKYRCDAVGSLSLVKRDVRAERAQNSLIILVMHFLHDVPLQIETLPNEIRRNQIRPTHLTKIQSFHSGTNQQKGA